MFYITQFKNQIFKDLVLSPFCSQLYKWSWLIHTKAAKLRHAAAVKSRIWNTESTHLSLLLLRAPLKWEQSSLKVQTHNSGEEEGSYTRGEKTAPVVPLCKIESRRKSLNYEARRKNPKMKKGDNVPSQSQRVSRLGSRRQKRRGVR